MRKVVDELPTDCMSATVVYDRVRAEFLIHPYTHYLTLDRCWQVGRKMGRSHFLICKLGTWEPIPHVAGQDWQAAHQPKVIS